MPFKRIKPPKEVYEELEKGLQMLPGKVDDYMDMIKPKLFANFRRIKQAEPEEMPHKIYIINLEDISSGKGFQKVRHIGWRHIVGNNAVEVHQGEHGENPHFAEINQGNHIKGIVETLKTMKAHSKLKLSDFELRIVTIPSIYVLALWLKSEDGSNDMVIPIEPCHACISEHEKTVFTPEEFIAILKPEADKRADLGEAAGG